MPRLMRCPVVLMRVELDTGQFEVFIDILRYVAGMDQIVKLLTTYNNYVIL